MSFEFGDSPPLDYAVGDTIPFTNLIDITLTCYLFLSKLALILSSRLTA
jgi:hypothetical protein